MVGVPFYGRIWSENGDFNGYGIGLSVISNMLIDYNAKITYDEKARSPKAEFTVKAGDKEYTVGGKSFPREIIQSGLKISDRYLIK